MTEAERLSRAQRAQAAWDEFFAPMFAELKSEYTSRIADVARTELHQLRRAESVGMLSVALKVVHTIESGVAEMIHDGKLALESKARADKVLQMSDAQQKLLKISGGY